MMTMMFGRVAFFSVSAVAEDIGEAITNRAIRASVVRPM